MDGPPDRHPSALDGAFASFWAALDAIEDPRDKAALLDCARAALDRGSRRFDASQDHLLVAGTFWLEKTLAATAVRTVLLVRHRDLGSRHALKTLQADYASDPVHTCLMRREATHHLRVRHPAVVAATVALRLDDGRPALLLDVVEGPTLALRLRAGPLGLEDTIVLGRRLASGLEAVHAAGLVHLDLTPANILLPDGDAARAQICDFGLSLPAGARRSGDDLAVAGTPGFAAPEQACPDHPLDVACDLFALGAVLARASGATGLASSPPLAALIAALQAPEPERRPAGAEAVARALAEIVAAGDVAS